MNRDWDKSDDGDAPGLAVVGTKQRKERSVMANEDFEVKPATAKGCDGDIVARTDFGDARVTAYLHKSGTNALGVCRNTAGDCFISFDLQLPAGGFRRLAAMFTALADAGDAEAVARATVPLPLDVAPPPTFATDVPCPDCGALPGVQCTDSDGREAAPHGERQRLLERTQDPRYTWRFTIEAREEEI